MSLFLLLAAFQFCFVGEKENKAIKSLTKTTNKQGVFL